MESGFQTITTALKPSSVEEQLANNKKEIADLKALVAELTQQNSSLRKRVGILEAKMTSSRPLTELRAIAEQLTNAIQSKQTPLLKAALVNLLNFEGGDYIKFTTQLLTILQLKEFSALMTLCREGNKVETTEQNQIGHMAEGENLTELAQQMTRTLAKHHKEIFEIVLEKKIKKGMLSSDQQGQLLFFIITQAAFDSKKINLTKFIQREQAINFFEHFSTEQCEFMFVDEYRLVNIKACKLYIALIKLYYDHKPQSNQENLKQLSFCLIETSYERTQQNYGINWTIYLKKLFSLPPNTQINIIKNIIRQLSVTKNKDNVDELGNLIFAVHQFITKNPGEINSHKIILKTTLTDLFNSLYRLFHNYPRISGDEVKLYSDKLITNTGMILSAIKQLADGNEIKEYCQKLSSTNSGEYAHKTIKLFGLEYCYYYLIEQARDPIIKFQLITTVLASPYHSWFKHDGLVMLFNAFGQSEPVLFLVFHLLLINSEVREKVTKLFSSEKQIQIAGLNKTPDLSAIKLLLNGNFKFHHCHLSFSFAYQEDSYESMLCWLKNNDRENCHQLNGLRIELEKINRRNESPSLEILLRESITAANCIKQSRSNNPSPEGKRAVFCLYVMLYSYTKLHPLSYPVITGAGIEDESINICSYDDYCAKQSNSETLHQARVAPDLLEHAKGMELKTIPSTSNSTEYSIGAGMYGQQSRNLRGEASEAKSEAASNKYF